MPIDEFDLIDEIARKVANRSSNRREKNKSTSDRSAIDGVEIGIGDDAASIRRPTYGDRLIVTADMLIDHVHFNLATCDPSLAGRKTSSVNLSDMAAMGARPRDATLSLAVPQSMDAERLDRFIDGFLDSLDEFGVDLVGGDTNRTDGPFVASVTMFGEAGPRGPILRSGARPGDALFVTGQLGYSIHRRQFSFTPRVRESLELVESFAVRAMIDLSDGLAGDLRHLCRLSRVGAVVDGSALPVATADRPTNSQATEADDLTHALTDGEDFELLFAVDPTTAAQIERDEPLARFGVELTRIGELTDGSNVDLVDLSGVRRPLTMVGFRHRF